MCSRQIQISHKREAVFSGIDDCFLLIKQNALQKHLQQAHEDHPVSRNVLSSASSLCLCLSLIAIVPHGVDGVDCCIKREENALRSFCS
jgi:hypothetical protein